MMKLRTRKGGNGASGGDKGNGGKQNDKYKCPVYGKSFWDKFNYDRHIKICGKTDVYEYKCTSEVGQCGFSSKWYESYKKHMNNIHEEMHTDKYSM